MQTIDPSVFLAPGSRLSGTITIGKDSSVWYNSVIRGDANQVRVGERTNIQENCVLHENASDPICIGNDVTVGHGVILHGCTIGDNTVIGMGAIILNDAQIGKNCLIGAGSVVTSGTVNTKTAGTYEVEYSVASQENSSLGTARLTVIVQ